MSTSGGKELLSGMFTVPRTVVRQQIGSEGTSVSQQANYKLFKCLSPFRHSLLRCIFSLPCGLYFYALVSHLNVTSVSIWPSEAEESQLSASPPPPGFHLDVFVIAPL